MKYNIRNNSTAEKKSQAAKIKGWMETWYNPLAGMTKTSIENMLW